MFVGVIGYAAMKDDPKQQPPDRDEWAHTLVRKRPLIPPRKLRGVDRFVITLILALIADAAFAMAGMLSTLAG